MKSEPEYTAASVLAAAYAMSKAGQRVDLADARSRLSGIVDRQRALEREFAQLQHEVASLQVQLEAGLVER